MNETGKASEARRQCPQCGAILTSGALDGLCPACLLKQGASPPTQSPSAAFEPPSVESVQGLFPQLEILGLIGRGGMGSVYKARQPGLNRLVALKLLPPQSTPGFTDRFTREARALAQLNHPNIVAVYDFGQVAGGLHYLVMEFVDGLNLRQLERVERLSPREALRIIPQICEALQFAHDEGIVHRDIKPENVLIDKKGRVKIADFGLAKMLGQESAAEPLTGAGQVMGTPHYMAPEQIEHPAEVDHRADIYSLGVVFYEMLTGELPLGRFAPPSRKVQIDVRLDEVVLRALEKEPELRYDHVSELKSKVETISQAPTGGSPTTPSPSIPHGLPHGAASPVVKNGLAATFVWHGALLIGAAGLWGHFVPKVMQPLEELVSRFPPATELSLGIAKSIQHHGLVLMLLVLALDFAILAGLQRLFGCQARRWWSAALVAGTVLTAGAVTVTVYLPYSALIADLSHGPTPTVDAYPPVVVQTVPPAGAIDVEPGITELHVKFSKEMADGWSWSTAWEDSTPEGVTPPRYLDDRRTCVIQVKLEPGKTYGFWLNSEKFGNFKDITGKSAVPYLFTFRTRGQETSR